MKKSALFGTLAGGIAIAVAVPFVTQFASAQSSSVSSVSPRTRPVPSQACVQSMASAGDTSLSFFDQMNAARKTAVTARSAALKAAAALTDDTARQTAVTKAGEDFRIAMQTAMETKSTAMKSSHDAMQTACGDSRGFGLMMGKGGRGMMGKGQGQGLGKGPNLEMMAATLGITVDQLTSEIAGGKTIEQIAKEHGVTLPASSTNQKGRGGHFGGWKGLSGGQSSVE
ncbi:MAG: hypothetical protein PHZ00_02480 [Candidatus Peribacteraceae bacterium]|nr:hypothetical protein [Candidatus Peribacteraceae bacterium]